MREPPDGEMFDFEQTVHEASVIGVGFSDDGNWQVRLFLHETECELTIDLLDRSMRRIIDCYENYRQEAEGYQRRN